MFYKKVFCAGVSFLIKFLASFKTSIIPFLVNTSGGYFFQMSPNLKRRRTEHTQSTNELKTKQGTNWKLFFVIITNIYGRKNVNMICKDLVSCVARKTL